MPRNASGVYALPDPPRVPNTVIDSPDENITRDDIATELTNSLDRNGRGGMLAPFRIADGTLAAPGLAFLNEPGTGIYRAGAGDMRFVVQGAEYLRMVANTLTFGAGVNFGGNPAFNGNVTVNGQLILPTGQITTGGPTDLFLSTGTANQVRILNGPGPNILQLSGGANPSIGVSAGVLDLLSVVHATQQFLLTNGAVGAPAIAFIAETNSGLFRNNVGDIRFALLGVDALVFIPAAVVVASGKAFVASGLRVPLSNIEVTVGNDRASGYPGVGYNWIGNGVANSFNYNSADRAFMLKFDGALAAPAFRFLSAPVGAGAITFSEQLRVVHNSNAVNFFSIAGGTTGNAAVIDCQGSSDANVDIIMGAKGTGAFRYISDSGGGGSTEIFRLANNRFMKVSNTGTWENLASNNHEITQAADAGLIITRFMNKAPSVASQYGNQIQLDKEPNNATQYHLFCGYLAEKCVILSNGGIRNFQANNQNLSDARLKKDWEPYTVPQLEAFSAALNNVEFGRFHYRNQTHGDWNHGYIAQNVQRAFDSTAPELVSPFDQGGTEGLKDALSVYQTDLTNISLAVALHEIRKLKAEVATLKGVN